VVRGLVQRVSEAWVTSRDDAPGSPDLEVGRIGPGLVVLVGVTHTDGPAHADALADKVANLRVFADDAGAMNRSCLDVGGGVLVVSQFTLYGDTRKGRRPSFVDAAAPELAEPLIDRVAVRLADLGVSVATGRFRTHMRVGLVNDGPVTVLLEVPAA
jgi:D-aminoacyl-tRNA deacylase